nr:site-specific integrase [uncultured Prevotella sp.]
MDSIKIEISKAWLECQPSDIVIRLGGMVTNGGGHEARKGITLQEMLRNQAATLRREGRVRTAQTYESTLSSFMKYYPQAITPEELNAEIIKGYERWMQEKGLSRNTCSFYMRRLRAVYRLAAPQGMSESQSLFEQVFTGMERTKKRALPADALKMLLNTRCSNRHTAFALDMFRFSLFTRGMSFVDMCYLRRSDIRNGVLTYQRKKTGQLIRIRWEPQLEEIVNRYARECDGYLLPLVRKSLGNEYQQYKRSQHTQNNRLKAIGKKLKLPDPLTMYVARHSWASTAKRMNVPIQVISDSMGHTSERTTQIYLAQIDADIIDETNASIINFLESKHKK